MATSDPIADMLTRIRNATLARHPKVDVPASKLKMEIARILKEEGFIMNFKMAEEGAKKSIRIYLKYTPGNVPVISRIERASRPGCRVHVGNKEVPKALGGLGTNILTTPRGLMTGSTARKERARGEVATFTLGYSHPIEVLLPEGVDLKIDKQTHLTLSGYDKQMIGQVAANIRSLRPPDPYKNKGIRYTGEVLRKKVGKTGASGAGAK